MWKGDVVLFYLLDVDSAIKFISILTIEHKWLGVTTSFIRWNEQRATAQTLPAVSNLNLWDICLVGCKPLALFDGICRVLF